jgi:ribose 5-phosphate isomerase B
MNKTILLASDHGGLALKSVLIQFLRKTDSTVEDLGPDCTSSCDYPVFADKLTQRLLASGEDGQNGQVLGILICGTGLGMSMAANRHAGVRAAVCTNEFMARMARAHNNANVLCLGERVVGQGLAVEIVRAFLAAPFEGGRHLRRIEQFETYTQP